jgi:formate hydrogenlyase subunit 4
MKPLYLVPAFLVLAPVLGGLLVGADRIVTARMQSRVGPPVLQSFYDVFKLLGKENLIVNRFHSYYLFIFLIFMMASGSLFFAGQDLLMVIFALILADIFLVLSAYSTNSPYSSIGAERELLQMLSSEPMLLISAVGFYTVTGSFDVADIAGSDKPLILHLPGVFVGLIYVLTIQLRKSPFDLATSEHAHQELVKGVTTEFAGPSLALIEIEHWYRMILLLSMVYLFFAFNPLLGVFSALLVYFLEVLVDNSSSRVKWELMVKSAWAVTLILGVGNLLVLYFMQQG